MSLAVFDALVRHQLYLERVKEGQTVELNAALAAINEEVRKLLSLYDFNEIGQINRRQLQQLVRSLREIMRSSLDPYVADMTRWFEAYMREDREMLKAIFGEFIPAPQLIKVPNADKLSPLVLGAPMAATGLLALVFLKANATVATNKVERLAIMAYANNSTRAQLLASIVGTRAAQNRDGELNRIFRATKASNNTIIQHIAAQTNFNVARRLFDEYEWCSILDDATTQICRSRHGNRYRYGSGPIPPAHVGCRSNIIPVVAGQPEAPRTLSEWLKRQPDSVRTDLDRTKSLTLEQFKAKRSLILTP